MTALRIGALRDLRRELRKPVEASVGTRGYSTVPDGFELADIEVSVDIEKLARALGEKAMRSKGGVSKMQGGAVIVRATNRRIFK